MRQYAVWPSIKSGLFANEFGNVVCVQSYYVAGFWQGRTRKLTDQFVPFTDTISVYCAKLFCQGLFAGMLSENALNVVWSDALGSIKNFCPIEAIMIELTESIQGTSHKTSDFGSLKMANQIIAKFCNSVSP